MSSPGVGRAAGMKVFLGKSRQQAHRGSRLTGAAGSAQGKAALGGRGMAASEWLCTERTHLRLDVKWMACDG